MRNILIRSDSSSKIGIGHVMRDLVLAEQFEKDKVFFATRNLEGNINEKITDSGYKIFTLKTNGVDELISLINDKKIDMLIIDHYNINYEYETYIKEKTVVKIFCLDDTYKKHNCDILLNHNISAQEDKYNNIIPDNCEIRCGIKYTLIRKEFIEEKKKRKKKNKNNRVKTVFIAMGGADHSNINLQILDVLSEFCDKIKAIVVTTNANKNLNELIYYSAGKEWIDLCINSNKIAYLMTESDLAIVTPSVTINEVVFMELPFIAIKTAENQNDMYEYLVKNNYPILKEFDSILLIEKILILYNYFSVGI
ncbi:MAG: UDP-2,4-diacetamido-2,4,6-trideoxy-beta-L-altropyranose hydrolase [Candidatus Cloacimonetes bacterium]|nr:UDP-2,4-diacetamido-2,4,6-trideoxy-beta-L-altropyranose hydrolase [Candidatus Cloacimonadota bacterium]